MAAISATYGETGTAVRPTEGQLRWSQFHHKRRAVQVRSFLQTLYQSPATPDQVDGVLPDDANSSSSCSDAVREIRKRRRPSISKGRRALLRVSKRHYEQRRLAIQKNGFQGIAMEEEINAGDDEADEHENALNEIFMVQPSRRRRRKGPRNRHGKDPSFERFQAACHAMMMNLAAPPKHSISMPTRKWTRTVDPAAALDQDYLDVKWGIRRRPQHDEETAGTEGGNLHLAPMDRGASWMMHLPKPTSTARDNPYYHDPSLALPPSVGSHFNNQNGDDDDTHSMASTLALQAPGAQKFNRLVSLVQQRMIEKHQEAVAADEVPTMRLRKGETGGSSREGPWALENKEYVEGIQARNTPIAGEFHVRRNSFASPFSSQGPVRERKSHYVPRMRLRDFLPDGTTEEEVEELERSVLDGKGIPPTMKLRGFPTAPAASPRRRKSRAQELAESFEPTEERCLSKTRQMAKSLEGKPKYPKMRLRQSIEFQNDDEEEKKLSEDGVPGRLDAELPKCFDGKAGDIVGSEGRQRESQLNVNKSRNQQGFERMDSPSQASGRIPRSVKAEDMADNYATEPQYELQDPPRRKSHPLSDRFVQSIEASQAPPAREQTLVRPLPPGACCARCAKESPVAALSTRNSDAFSFNGRDSTGTRVRNLSMGSARVSDFFSQLRDATNNAMAPVPDSHAANKRESAATASTKNSTGSQRVSDFFAKVRQSLPRNEGTPVDNEVPFEDTDFFAEVREMIATSDDDEESAAQRVSDFFAQVREKSEEMEEERANILCEDCQVQDIEDNFESASVSLSPSHDVTPVLNPSRASQISAKTLDDDTKSDTNKSDHSAFSGLWNRGRSSLNYFASNLNAISEKTAQVASNPQAAASRLSTSSMPARMGGFLQRLQGMKDQQQARHSAEGGLGVMGEQGHSNEADGKHKGQDLEFDSENDLETMAAYRESQELKRLSAKHDDASSNSSYHILPDGIREMVKRQSSLPEKPPRAVSSPSRRGTSGSSSEQSIFSPQSNYTPSEFSPLRGEPYHAGNMDAGPVSSALPRPSTNSPSRASVTSSALENLSPEKYREAHGKVMQNSPLMGSVAQGIIDTDGTTSDASYSGLDPKMLASLMLSPDILQKRLHQAVRAIEGAHWDQVKYLLNANPWLAEMCELTTNQYLLHKISFFGSSAPTELCVHLMEMFPSAVHKFDHDGNVPLHLAAAAGHLKMIRMLGEKFESGASIRNEDGMLPLHFTIASYADFEGPYGEENQNDENDPSPLEIIKTVLKFFPKAVAIGDNDGNLPIHIAAECLRGGFGVDVIYMLLDEADCQLQDPYGARFHNKIKLEDIVNDDISPSTPSTDGETDSSLDENIHCNMVKNDYEETPLLSAVRSRRGWDVIEALISGPGGSVAALNEDADKNNVLHLLVGEYQDPAAAMSVLKIVPRTATVRNNDGMLPIEVACLQLMPEEVILAIALVDLPFDVDDKGSTEMREEHGASWWFLVCECDDHYVDIVQQIVMICTFEQIQELCSMKKGTGQKQDNILARATPKSKLVLSHASRFLGRFELLQNSPVDTDSSIGLNVFNAVDHAYAEENEEGRRVILRCYANIQMFTQATAMLRDVSLDTQYVEEVTMLADDVQLSAGPRQFCVATECPQVTLDRVVDGMANKGGYRYDTELRKKYAAKMCAVLRMIAKAIRHLHDCGLIHGNICMEACGKFGHAWKLLDCMGVQRIGEFINVNRFERSFPPEALDLDEDDEETVFDSDNASISFLSAEASISIDVWAFGKLAYETLAGKPLVEFDPAKGPTEDVAALLEILEWDQSSMKSVFSDLLDSGVTDSCAELITSCLFPRPQDRPTSMDAILADRFWKDMRQYRERSSPSKGRRGESASSSSTKSIFTETSSAVDRSQELETAEI